MDKTYIIAEMSANHSGSLSIALDIVRAAKEAGADCIKLQTYTADTITLDAKTDDFLIKDGLWKGQTLHDLYSHAYTPWEWQPEIKKEADAIGIDFLSTPFDNTAVDFLEELGVKAYKIASFEMTDIPLLHYVAKKGKPIIISTGMATVDEIQEAVDAIKSKGNSQITLLKCSSAYPALPEQMNLLTIPDMMKRFGLPVGLSDHSMENLGAVTAVALGATVIEKHFCLSRKLSSADAAFSLEPAEFADMVRSIRLAESMCGSVFYGPTEHEIGSLFGRRSIFSSADIKKGDLFTNDNIRVVRPGTGMHSREFFGLLNGKRAACDIPFATPLKKSMIQ